MTVTTLKPGKPIILRLLLEDGDEDKFVRAFLTKDSGVPLSGSPYALPHVSNGLYVFKDANNLVYPGDDTDEVHAVYITYNDSNFNEESEIHYRSTDIYQSSDNAFSGSGETPGQDDQGKSGLTTLIGIVSQQQVLAEISQIKLTGVIKESPIVLGVIKDEGLLSGIVQRDFVVGVIESE